MRKKKERSHFLLEFVEHTKYSVSAVVLALVGAYFAPIDSTTNTIELFHLFHYPHISFACATAFINYMRHHSNLIAATLVSVFVPMFFCTLSDVLLPFFGGRLLGVDMQLHLCFLCNKAIILSFLCIGLLIGYVSCLLQRYRVLPNLYGASLVSHFLHELVSSIASIVYTIGFGFFAWKQHLVQMFFLMACSVIIPCLFSDLIMPLFFARILGKKTYGCSLGVEKPNEKCNS